MPLPAQNCDGTPTKSPAGLRQSRRQSRREWLGGTLSAIAGLTTASVHVATVHMAGATGPAGRTTATAVAGTFDPSNTIPVIDTHQHLWDLQQLRTPWLQTAPAVLRNRFLTEEYVHATAGLSLRSAIYMEIDVHPDDQQKEADLILQQIAAGTTPTIAAVISGRPNTTTFETYIRPLSRHSAIKGVRQVLHAPSAKRGLCLEPQFVKSMRLLGDLGLSFDLCVRPGELADAVALVQKCPETQFVLDHCGNAHPDAFRAAGEATVEPPHSADQWKRDIDDMAACPNAACKISGIIASVKPGQDFVESLRPIVHHCLDSFGPDRVVFGGDWPVCLLGATFVEWVTTLREILKPRPIADQQKLWHENATRIYRLQPE